MSGYVERHEAEHGDRTGSSTRYVEVCWKCARDWTAYVLAHGWRGDPEAPVVLAMRPAATQEDET